jgi:hypothetical protein
VCEANNIRFEYQKNTFLVMVRASRPNKERACKPSTMSRFKPGPYRFELRGS